MIKPEPKNADFEFFNFTTKNSKLKSHRVFDHISTVRELKTPYNARTEVALAQLLLLPLVTLPG